MKPTTQNIDGYLKLRVQEILQEYENSEFLGCVREERTGELGSYRWFYWIDVMIDGTRGTLRVDVTRDRDYVPEPPTFFKH